MRKLKRRPELLVCILLVTRNSLTQRVLVLFFLVIFEEYLFDRNWLLEPQQTSNKKEARWDVVLRQ